MRVVIAPDSLKGTCAARDAARAIADGWLSVRPGDDVVMIPLADGGEGTIDVIEASLDADRRTAVVSGPVGRQLSADWLMLPSGEAIIELAQAAGLTLVDPLDPTNATTSGVGELIRIALGQGATVITVALGGSATTDGGTGALTALGLRLFDDAGLPLPPGGAALGRLAWIDDQDLVPAPAGGVRLLTDVTNPLLGPTGAAAVFGPQKGADVHQVEELEGGLRRLAEIVGTVHNVQGMGAAGGSAYGLTSLWGAKILPGAVDIARLCGLVEALECSDLVITAEGRFDATSMKGKVVGHVLDQKVPEKIVIAGSFATACPTRHLSLECLAGTAAKAQRDPKRWLGVAGAQAALNR